MPTSIFLPDVDVEAADAVTGTVTIDPARLRSGPDRQAELLALLPDETQVVLGGITEDQIWVLVRVVDPNAELQGAEGWMSRQQLAISGDLATLPRYDEAGQRLTPPPKEETPPVEEAAETPTAEPITESPLATPADTAVLTETVPLDLPTVTPTGTPTVPLAIDLTPAPADEPEATPIPLPSVVPSDAVTPTLLLPEAVIWWDQAHEHVAEPWTVCGVVISVTADLEATPPIRLQLGDPLPPPEPPDGETPPAPEETEPETAETPPDPAVEAVEPDWFNQGPRPVWFDDLITPAPLDEADEPESLVEEDLTEPLDEAAQPAQFDVLVVNADPLALVDADLEALYLGRTVCVAGIVAVTETMPEVEETDAPAGVPFIAVQGLEEIMVLADADDSVGDDVGDDVDDADNGVDEDVGGEEEVSP